MPHLPSIVRQERLERSFMQVRSAHAASGEAASGVDRPDAGWGQAPATCKALDESLHKKATSVWRPVSDSGGAEAAPGRQRLSSAT